MKYRHEWKYEITDLDVKILQMRLSAVMMQDKHTKDGKYYVRSLYFDTQNDKALREKTDGVNCREKFRIRYYNGDTSYIVLEKKIKHNGLCAKETCRISREEASKILNKEFDMISYGERLLLRELIFKIKTEGLSPKTIVDYTRIPYVFGPGNVRVTIDSNIRTSMYRTDFLNPETLTLPAGEAPVLLEVKWDEFLPDIVKRVVSVPGKSSYSFSKYAQCRIYG